MAESLEGRVAGAAGSEPSVKCHYCAEDIQDAAVLCRFCGAVKGDDGRWRAPSPVFPAPAGQHAATPVAGRKGAFTIRFAGGLFVLSGIFSLVFVQSEVPLLGAMRGGVVAMAYNAGFAVLFLGVGLGLILGTVWGYRLLFIATVIYTLDRGIFLLDAKAREAYLGTAQISDDVAQLVDLSMIEQATSLTILAIIVCWWGFAAYIYFRREYFQIGRDGARASTREASAARES